MTKTSNINDHLNVLTVMADSFDVKTEARLTYDLDHDGLPDQIHIRYLPVEYEFNVKFGNSSGPGQTARAPITFERTQFNNATANMRPYLPSGDVQKFYLKDENGNATGAIDWKAVHERYGDPIKVLFHPQLRQILAGLSVLFRSESFREAFTNAVDGGMRFAIDGGSNGMYYDPASDTVALQRGTEAVYFLAYLPHELSHEEYFQPEDPTAFDTFVRDYVMNEVEADKFSIKVFEEAGLEPSELWMDSYNLYTSYKIGGEEGLLRERARHLDQRGLTYVEKAFLIYTIPEGRDDEFERQVRLLSAPRVEMENAYVEFLSYVQTEISNGGKKPEEMVDSAVNKIAKREPLIAEFAKTNRDEYVEAIVLLAVYSGLNQKVLEDEARANCILARLKSEYRRARLEEIRVQNARELGIERYY